MRRLLFVLAIASCRSDGRSPDRPPVHPGSATLAQPEPATAPATTEPASATTPTPTQAPAGTDKVVAPPADVADKIALKEIAHGLRRPVLLVVAPGDARRRLFIIEQRGAIRILENGKLLPKPFFTISGLSTGNEQGLLGLAFHPKFASNGKLYINYTTRDDATHIDEYKVAAKDPDAVDTASKRELIVIEQPYSNHNGGHLEFGPDGKLYTGMGDGGAANDPHDHGQNAKSLLAKILRFDVDAAKPTPEIVHLGVRNPWRFTFDRKTGDLFIGDVGQNLWEYVFAVSGADKTKKNFGWNIVEGSHCFNPDTGGGKKSCDKTGFTLPIAEYAHEQGCSITGGVVYRGKALPMLDGRYFYGDFCTGLLRSLTWTRDASSPTAVGFTRDHWEWKPAIDKRGELSQISSFGVDHDGELYIVTLTGNIFQLVPKS